jgi:hypothetical protein
MCIRCAANPSHDFKQRRAPHSMQASSLDDKGSSSNVVLVSPLAPSYSSTRAEYFVVACVRHRDQRGSESFTQLNFAAHSTVYPRPSPLLMADSQLCTCCTAQASMRCSACYAVGIVVPFCSAEHQKLVSQSRFVGRRRRQSRGAHAAEALIRASIVH